MARDKYPEIRSFEDLKCWKEAGKLWSTLIKTLDNAGEKSYIHRILAEEIYMRSLRIMEDIAASFSVNDLPSFLDGIKEALKQCMRLRSLLHTALDSGLIEPDKMDGIYQDIDSVTRAIKEHIRYLTNMEIKKRYREMEDL